MVLSKGFARNAATTPLDTRLMDMGSLVCNADGSPRVGVLGSHTPAILTALATMQVAIAAAEFVTSKGKADGVMRFTNDGVVNVLITNAPASNSRIDVIYVKHNDSTTGDATSTPVLGVQVGIAAAAPVKPAIPTGALELGTLRVYAGSTAANNGGNVLTNTYGMTAARGGVVPFRTKVELDAWTTASDGQLAVILDDNGPNPLYVWNGTTWQRNTNVLAKVSSAPALQSGIAAAEVNLTNMSITFTLARAGDVRIAGGFNSYGGTVDNIIIIRLKEGATALADFPRAANSSPTSAAISNYHNFATTLPFTAGTHTVYVAALRAAGAGGITVAPGVTNLSQLSAEMLD